jgi:hypothetical protein
MRIITYIPFGVKNKNGRIYTAENFEHVQSKIESGTMLGELGHPDRWETSMMKATHTVVDIDIDDDFCLVTADLLSTGAGMELGDLMSISGHDLILSPRGTGKVNPDGTVSDYTVFTFDLIPSCESAFDKGYGPKGSLGPTGVSGPIGCVGKRSDEIEDYLEDNGDIHFSDL